MASIQINKITNATSQTRMEARQERRNLRKNKGAHGQIKKAPDDASGRLILWLLVGLFN